MENYYKLKWLKLNTKYYVILLLIILIGCTHDNLSKKYKSETDIYKESFYENINNNKIKKEIPISILKRNLISDNNKNIYYLNNKTYKTWISEHFDENKILIGEHNIYWNIEDSFIKEKMLEPVK